MTYEPSASARRLATRNAPKRTSWRQPLTRVLDFVALMLVASGVALIPQLGWRVGLGAILSGLVVFGAREMLVQDLHSIVRVYGPIGRLRYLFEKEFRDKFLQYFNESDSDGRPLPRIVRDYVYQKAKGLHALSSFGTQLDNDDEDNTPSARILHRNFGDAPSEQSFLLEVGARREGVRAFEIRSVVNVSGMSFGSINSKAAECLSIGARGHAYVNTGEGGYGPHGIAGNDVVFQIGTGKFGVGRMETLPDGRVTRVLDEKLLQDLVRGKDNIRMLQVKLSQGAKPGIGGHLPGEKVTEEIAEIRKIPAGRTIISPTRHAELAAASPRDSVAKLMTFTARLRELTGLPVGIKLCVGKLDEVEMLVEAMAASGEGPDAIQIDGADGGTGAGPNLFVNYVGYGGAIETLAHFHRRLQEAGIRDRVVLSASGRLATPAHAVVAFAFGADYIDTARGALLALGCIQSLKCHTNECPTGITTNHWWRKHGIDLPEKSTRVHRYLTGYHHDVMELAGVLGHTDPRDIVPSDLRLVDSERRLARVANL